MTIDIPAANLGTKPKKEMLNVKFEVDPILHRTRPVVTINFSSMDIINTCKRKAFYALEKDLRSNEEGPATLFGSAIHKGLEHWYCSPKATRTSRTSDCLDDAGSVEHSLLCARCSGIRAFNKAAEPLGNLEIGDKRHPFNGLRLLHKYFDQYLDDPFEILSDEHGPIVERRIEFTLIDDPKLKIICFGTIDAVLKDTSTGTILVTDHKTTSTLGAQFYARIKPNHQYTIYTMGVQRDLGIDTDMFMVNGLQVAKTKADLARQITQRTAEDFEEATDAIRSAVEEYLHAKETNTWPMNAPNPCTQYGACQYLQICSAPKSLRENIIEGMYKNG